MASVSDLSKDEKEVVFAALDLLVQSHERRGKMAGHSSSVARAFAVEAEAVKAVRAKLMLTK